MCTVSSNICLYAQLHGICIKTYLRMYWSASVSRMHVVYTHPVCKLLSACGVTFRHVQRRACIYSIYGMALSFFLLSSFLPFFLYSFLLSFYSSLCHVSFLSYHCVYLSVWLSLSIYRSISWWDINGFHHFCKNCENIYIYIQNNPGCYRCNPFGKLLFWGALGFSLTGCYIKPQPI